MGYKPLPESLTIKPSNIDGLGLFAIEDILNGTSLGTTHVYNKSFENGLIRTPLGGFFNHSENPNTELINTSPGILEMVVIKDISSGDEITSKYKIYDPITK